MELKEVLARVPGLPKRFIHYAESQGYIRPVKLPKVRIARRGYREEDMRILQGMWPYYQRGYSLKSSFDLYTRSQHVVAYAGFLIPPRQWTLALERMRTCPLVAEAAAVHSATINFLVKARVPEAGELYHTLVPILAEVGIIGSPILWMAQERFQREARPDEKMLAYVLMTVPGKNVGEVMSQLKELEGVVEASTVYGESDIIAKVRVPNQEALDTLVMDKIHGIPAVVSTRTFIVISRLHWTSES